MLKDSVHEVVHDVKSKCASLCSAADLLSKASPKERQRLLRLMETQARSLFSIFASWSSFEEKCTQTGEARITSESSFL
jgi:hypothetical protein